MDQLSAAIEEARQETAMKCWAWIESQGTIETANGSPVFYVCDYDLKEFRKVFGLDTSKKLSTKIG